MTALNLNPEEEDALVKFMEVGLTDPRVAWERAPFDHPSLALPDGHSGDENTVLARPLDLKVTTPRAQDAQLNLKAIGAEGRSQSEGPLRGFYNDI
ncbi:hypothetical protein D3C80_1651830 [compost metagenome]